MNQELKNKLQWINERINAFMDHEFPYPQCIDLLIAERDRLTAQVLKDEMEKIDWGAERNN